MAQHLYAVLECVTSANRSVEAEFVITEGGNDGQVRRVMQQSGPLDRLMTDALQIRKAVATWRRRVARSDRKYVDARPVTGATQRLGLSTR